MLYSAHWDHSGAGEPDARGGRIFSGALGNAGAGLLYDWIKPLEQGLDVKLFVGSHGGCTRLLASKASGITTLEGLGSRERPDPLQAAFVTHQAAQCGYCLNGMIMTAKALLLRNPHPSEQEIKQALRYNLCRCGTHVEILAAVMTAAGGVTDAPR